MSVCMNACLYVYLYVCIYACMYVYIYISIHMYFHPCIINIILIHVCLTYIYIYSAIFLHKRGRHVQRNSPSHGGGAYTNQEPAFYIFLTSLNITISRANLSYIDA